MRILCFGLAGGVVEMPRSGMALAGWSSCEALKSQCTKDDEILIMKNVVAVRKKALIKKFKPDVIFLSGLAWHQFNGFYPGLEDCGIPVVPHILSGDCGWADKPNYEAIHANLGKCSKIVCRSILSLCHFLYNKVDHRKLVYVPEAFDINIFKPRDMTECRKKHGLPTDMKIAGIFGGKSKGMYQNIAALKRMYKEHPSLKDKMKCIWMYSSYYPASVDLKKLLMSELDGNVYCFDHANPDGKTKDATQMSELLNCCDVVSIPSIHEGFGRVQIETQLSGVPLVTCKGYGTSCYENILDGKTGFAVKSIPVNESHCTAQVDRLAAAIYRISMYDELRSQMSVAARSWTKDKFSYAAVGGELLEILRSCV